MTWTGAAPVAPPPGYDPAHPERDPVGAAAAREAAARASAVRVEKAKVRTKMKVIYRPSLACSLSFVLPFFIHLLLDPEKKSTQQQLLREELKKCYKESGVNHLQDCAELVDKYMSAIKGGSGTEVRFFFKFFLFSFFGFGFIFSLCFHEQALSFAHRSRSLCLSLSLPLSTRLFSK